MENKRSSWGAIWGDPVGSAVGLGNIWGFPYKMGRSGGFTFLLIYLLLAVFVGLVIWRASWHSAGKTGLGVVGAYQAVSKKFGWVGWLGVLSPFLIMSFYAVLGGYCIQYMSLNMAELSFNLSDIFRCAAGRRGDGAMLDNPFGCAVFTALFLFICMMIVKGGVSEGIEKFNKIGMPALFVMLVIVIIRSLTLSNAAVEGLKYMFVPGYAVEAGSSRGAERSRAAGGQMFFAVDGRAMVTAVSEEGKHQKTPPSSSDTIVSHDGGPRGHSGGGRQWHFERCPVMIARRPKLLFVTLQ